MFFCFLGGHNKSCSVRLKYNGDHCNRPVKDLDFIEPELEHGVRVVLQCVPHVPEKNLSLSQATHISLSQVPAAVECHYEERPIFDSQYFVFEALLSAHHLSSVKMEKLALAKWW